MRNEIRIGGRPIGPGHPVYVIAEMSASHNREFDRAVELVRVAHAAGADAVKLQTYTADTLTIASERPEFQITGGPWGGQTIHQFYEKASMPWEWQPKLKDVADDLGIDLFSTAYDETAIEFLEGMGVPAHKVASFENVDLPLVRRMARTGKPLFISTGMAPLAQVEETVETARKAGAGEIALLKCTSADPAPVDEMNLRTIPDMAARFRLPVGLSDHTVGVEAVVAAVALGACIVEKHYTLPDRPGIDGDFALRPEGLAAMVNAIRATEAALGSVSYGPTSTEKGSKTFQRSLYFVTDLPKGTVVTERHVRTIRPGHGLHPRHYEDVLGRRVVRDVPRGTPVSFELLEPVPAPSRSA
ncbi:MAG: pseudaminic acid synthase [Methanobacteriota archaeon]